MEWVLRSTSRAGHKILRKVYRLHLGKKDPPGNIGTMCQNKLLHLPNKKIKKDAEHACVRTRVVNLLLHGLFLSIFLFSSNLRKKKVAPLSPYPARVINPYLR